MPVFFSKNTADWFAVDGVYIAELDQPADAELDGNAGLTKIVGQFPWGPTDEIIELGSSAELKKLLGNASSPEDYKGFRSIVGKKWGPLHVVRISEGAQAQAAIIIRSSGLYTVGTYDTGDDYSLTFSSVDGNGPYTVTALSGDHSNEDDVYSHLETEINNHNVLQNHVDALAELSSDQMLVTGSGDEDWSVSLNSPATGSHNFASPTEQYQLNAKYPGAAGNEISVDHVWHPGSPPQFEFVLSWGAETQRFGPYDFDGSSGVASTINDDLGNGTWVDFSWHANFNGDRTEDRSNFVSLVGGTDASLGSSKSQPYVDGLDVLAADEDGGQIFVAETELNETANDAVISKGQSVADGSRARFLAQAVGSSDTLDSRISKAGTYADDRLALAAHRVKQFIEGSLRTVDLIPFVASAMANSPPNKSPAAWSNREYFQAIGDFEDGVSPTRADYVEAVDQGALVLEREQGGIWKLRSGVTTDTTAGKQRIARRVMTDYVGINVGQALLPYQNEPPRPDVVDGVKSAVDRRLERMEGTGDIPESQLIEDFTNVVDAVQSDSVRFKLQVELWGEMRHIIAAVTVGAQVTIEEEA